MTTKPFPRKVVISPSYGAGICTWWSYEYRERAYDFIEDPAFIQWVIEELPIVRSKWQAAQISMLKLDDYVKEYVVKYMVATGRWAAEELEEGYFGGIDGAQVVTVTAPYRITEYDGAESIVQIGTEFWRM